MKCDRCREEFEPQEYRPSLFPGVKVFDQISFGKADERSRYMLPQSIRLCPECNKSFARWLDKGRRRNKNG